MKFKKSNFTKEELDVLFYALNRYLSSEVASLITFQEAERVTGVFDSRFVNSLKDSISIIEALKRDLICCMLSYSGSDLKPE